MDQVIDQGAFGQVVKCIDMREGGREVALKLSKNKKSETDNAAVEAKLLTKILGKDPDKYCIVKMMDHFYFRKHFVIVFELLDMKLAAGLFKVFRAAGPAAARCRLPRPAPPRV